MLNSLHSSIRSIGENFRTYPLVHKAMLCVAVVGCGGASGPAGDPGSISLIRQDAEPPGANCETGGIALHSGVDADANRELDDVEITQTSFVCHGAAGAEGAPGATGEAGAPAMIRLEELPPDAACSSGGTSVLAGVDVDRNGLLDDVEVSESADICNGSSEAGCRAGFEFNYGWCMETALRPELPTYMDEILDCQDEGLVLCPAMLPNIGRLTNVGVASTLGGDYNGNTGWLNDGLAGWPLVNSYANVIMGFSGTNGGAGPATPFDPGHEYACCYPAPPP